MHACSSDVKEKNEAKRDLFLQRPLSPLWQSLMLAATSTGGTHTELYTPHHSMYPEFRILLSSISAEKHLLYNPTDFVVIFRVEMMDF